MAAVDLILLLLLLASVLLGLWRGLVYELLSIAGWVAAFLLAQTFAAWAGERLPLKDFTEPLRYAAGFIAVFVAAAFGAGLLSWLMGHLVDSVGLGPVEPSAKVFLAALGCVAASACYGISTPLMKRALGRMEPLQIAAGLHAVALLMLVPGAVWSWPQAQFTPMALLAVAIMGGLIVATALTLLALPAMYAAWFRVKRETPALP